MTCDGNPYEISNCDGSVYRGKNEVLVYPLSEKTEKLSGIFPCIFLGRVYPYDIEMTLAACEREYKGFGFYVSDTIAKYLSASRKHLNIY